MSSSVMNAPSYAFLSKPPPPPQKTRPLCPPPPAPVSVRKRSSTFSAIAAWAAHVQPGSPGSPPSRRRSSFSRRPSSPHTSSFLVVDTPSPDPKEFAVDLTNLGYTSVFVHLSQTPITPSPVLMASKTAPTRPTPLKRLRSFSILRHRSNSTATAVLPPSPINPLSPSTPDSPKIIAASIAQRKKAVYAFAKSSSKPKPKPTPSKPKAGLPPSLASELALMQFADGGSTEENVKRLMEAQARAAAPAGTKASSVTAVGDVYRDGKGGIWWDREEEMEYVHLLGGHEAGKGPEKWVEFGGEVREGNCKDDDEDQEERGLAIASLATDVDAYGRRGSANSIGSLDPCNIIKPAEEDAKVVRVPLRLPASVPAMPKTPTPEPILTIPSRPRHAHHHLRASSNFFLLDLNAFSVPRTPRTPHTPRLRNPAPASTYTSTARYTPICPSHSPSHPYSHPQQQTHAHAQRKRGAARRRPAPLNIVAHVPMRGVSPDHGNDGNGDENGDENGDARTDFLEASFVPVSKPAREPEAQDAVEKLKEVQVEVKEVEVEMVKEMPVKMHREAVYRVPSNVNASLHANGNGNGNAQESWKALKKKASRPLLSLFGLK